MTTLQVHETGAFDAPVVVNREWRPDLAQFGAVWEIVYGAALGQNSARSNSSNDQQRLFITPHAVDSDTLKNHRYLQISISQLVVQLYGLSPRERIEIVPLNYMLEANVDYVQIVIKGQNINRSDLRMLFKSLIGKCIYVGQSIKFIGIAQAQVRAIFRNGVKALSGVVTRLTHPVFRTLASKMYILFQISQELWNFEENGEALINKAVDGFLPLLFHHWERFQANHSVSILLFARVYRNEGEQLDPDSKSRYTDFFRIVLDEVFFKNCAHIVWDLKLEIQRFRRDILIETVKSPDGNERQIISGAISSASRGNVLEAINLVANQLQQQLARKILWSYVCSIIVLTGGTGIFHAPRELLDMTTDIITYLDVEVGIVSVSRPALHLVPVFCCPDNSKSLSRDKTSAIGVANGESVTSRQSLAHGKSPDDDRSPMETFTKPFFCDIYYYPLIEEERFIEDTRRGIALNCRMDELQMMDFTENDLSEISVPYLRKPPDQDESEWFRTYDESCFVFQPSEDSSRNTIIPSFDGRDLGLSSAEPFSIPRRMPSFATYNRPQSLSATSQISIPRKLSITSLGLQIKPDVPLTRSSVTTVTIERGTNIISSPKNQPSDNGTQDTGNYVRQRRLSSEECHSKILRSSSNDDHSSKLPDESDINAQLEESSLVLSDSTEESDLFGSTMKYHSHPARKQSGNLEDSLFWRKWKNIAFHLTVEPAFNWTKLCIPAYLPLTADSLPEMKEIERNYKEYTYSISLDSEEGSYTQEILMRELIGQRLCRGFQIIEYSSTEAAIKRATYERRGVFLKAQLTSNDIKFAFLSLSDREIHKLTCDPNGLDIEVKRFIKHKQPESRKISYSFRRSYSDEREFTRHTLDLQALNTSDEVWSYIDLVTSGYEYSLTDAISRWRARFAVIPIEVSKSALSIFATNTIKDTLNEEEVRISGITRLFQLIRKNEFRFGSDGSSIDRSDVTQFLHLTSLAIPSFVENMAEQLIAQAESKGNAQQQPSGSSSTEKLRKADIKLEQLLNILQSTNGVLICDRRWHYRQYTQCFLGSDLVTWLMNNFADIKDRDDAINLGNYLKDAGLFVHVEARHKLLDGYYFYRFVTEKRKYDAKSWFKLHHGASKGLQEIADAVKNAVIKDSKAKIGPLIELSRAIELDVDLQNQSYRPEYVTIHEDTVYNPMQCYHFEIEWIAATASLIENVLRSWTHMLERYGLRIVAEPVNEISQIPQNQPLSSLRTITLKNETAPIPATLVDENGMFRPDADPLWWSKRILHYWGFVLDVDAASSFPQNYKITYIRGTPGYKYPQYIHCSGVALVQIPNKTEFLWAVNKPHMSQLGNQAVVRERRASSQEMRPIPNRLSNSAEPEILFAVFSAFCNDKVQLEQFFDDTIQAMNRNSASSSVSISSQRS